MLDIRRIREESDQVKTLLAKKGGSYPIDRVLELDREWRKALFSIEQLKAERNRVSQDIAQAKRKGIDASLEIERMREVGAEIARLEASVDPINQELTELLLTIPNTPLPDVPDGADAAANREVYRYGEPVRFDFDPKAHWDIGESLGIIDFERARKIAGARFSVLSGAGARLSRALIAFMLDHAVAQGYREMAPPYIANRESMVGTGQFPKFVDDVFRLTPHEYYLIPTAEVPLTNYHRGEIFDAADLPKKYTAYTASFRSEAGAAGRDTRGLIRQHQFDKVELVQVVKPETSGEALEGMRRDAESILETLEIPFHTVLLCGGDMGFGQAKTYDIEVWMPSYERYVEISSVSLMTDFQARRADIRYRPEDGGKKTDFVHTLNGSALAVGRTIAALLENYQTKMGDVRIPVSLVPYMGGIEQLSIDD